MFEAFKTYFKPSEKYYINISDNDIYVFNYLKINKLTDKEVELELPNKIVIIEGIGLKVSKMVKGEILIKGKLSNLRYRADE